MFTNVVIYVLCRTVNEHCPAVLEATSEPPPLFDVTKACENADVARAEPYMWNNCEQRKGNVGWRRGSLTLANGVTILGKSEICIWHGHPALIQKGNSNPLWSDAIKHSFFGWAFVGPLLRTCVSLLVSLMSLSLSKVCSPRSSRATLRSTTLSLACFLSLPAIV